MTCYTINEKTYEADTPADAAQRFFTDCADRRYGEGRAYCEYLTLRTLESRPNLDSDCQSFSRVVSYTYSAVLLSTTEELPFPFHGAKPLCTESTCVVEEVREDLLLDHPSLDSFFPKPVTQPLLENYRVSDVMVTLRA